MNSDNWVEALVAGSEDGDYCKSEQKLEDVGKSSKECSDETLTLLKISTCLCVRHKSPIYSPCADEHRKS